MSRIRLALFAMMVFSILPAHAFADTLGEAMGKAFADKVVPYESLTAPQTQGMDVFESPGEIQVSYPQDYEDGYGWRPVLHEQTGMVFIFPAQPVLMEKVLCEKTGRRGYWMVSGDTSGNRYMVSIIPFPKDGDKDMVSKTISNLKESIVDENVSVKEKTISGGTEMIALSDGKVKRRIQVVGVDRTLVKMDIFGDDLGELPHPFFEKRSIKNK